MNAFERWCEDLIDENDEELQAKIKRGIDEREYYVSRIFDIKRLKERWDKIGYTPPIPKQLELF